MITYRNIKTVNHMLTHGMATPTLLTYLDTQPETPNRGVITVYDKALDILGFPQYLMEIYGLKKTAADRFTLHELYVTILGEFLGEDMLDNHQKAMFYNTKTNTTRAWLSNSKRYLSDKEYYNGRVKMSKKAYADLYFVGRALLNTLSNVTDFRKLDEDNDTNMVMRFSNKLKTAYAKQHDLRMISTYRNNKNLPYSGHIHPYLLTKIAKFLPELSNGKVTLYNALNNPRNKAPLFEALLLATFETHLTEGVTNIRQYLAPVIELGELITNRACIAYLEPEVPGEPEHFIVAFRYDRDTVFKADRTNIEQVVALRGIYYDKYGAQLLRKEGISVFDHLYKAAYKPKNGDYSDLRESNLTK